MLRKRCNDTLAWFKAQNAGVAAGMKNDAEVSVTQLTYSTEAVDLPVEVAVEKVTAGNLKLIHYFDPAPVVNTDCKTLYGSGAGYYYGFYDQNGSNLTLINLDNGIDDAESAGVDLPSGIDYAVMKVTITAPADATWIAYGSEPQEGKKVCVSASQPTGNYAYWDSTSNITWTQSQIIGALAETQAKIKVEQYGTNSTRARFFQIVEDGAGDIDELPISSGIKTSGVSDAFGLATAVTSPWKTEKHFGFFVDGVGTDNAGFDVGLKVSVGGTTLS